jgi:hypothetical protein
MQMRRPGNTGIGASPHPPNSPVDTRLDAIPNAARNISPSHSAQSFAATRIPVSPVTILPAFGVSCLAGFVFGMLPTNAAIASGLRYS